MSFTSRNCHLCQSPCFLNLSRIYYNQEKGHGYMKKLLMGLSLLMVLCGCSSKESEPKEYVYTDTTHAYLKQFVDLTLDGNVKDLDEIQAMADTIIVAKVTEVEEAVIVEERFMTPIYLSDTQVIKGENHDMIYLDGGRMNLEVYQPQTIAKYKIDPSLIDCLHVDKKTTYVGMMPSNYYELEVGKTYLFFIKDGHVISNGYGIFEAMNDTYSNVITQTTINLKDVQ